MKRYIWIFLAVFTFSVLAGCGKSAENFKEPTNFYYITTDVSFFEEDSVISPEIRETVQFNGNILTTINAYFQGPASEKLVSPFPAGLEAVDVIISGSTALLYLNDPFATLEGLDATIACSCICATITNMTDCEAVEIHIENTEGTVEQILYFSYEDLLFMDSFP